MMAVLIHYRPTIVAKYGPSFVRYNKTLTFTRQDSLMALFLLLHSGFYLAQLIEHILRHLDDIGLEGLFGPWRPMMIYDSFQSGQLLFTIFELMILYFMTFNKSKTSLKDKTSSN
ncbi:MAG: hypothetical protein ACI8WB_001221 [Phenylobacterium sp.]